MAISVKTNDVSLVVTLQEKSDGHKKNHWKHHLRAIDVHRKSCANSLRYFTGYSENFHVVLLLKEKFHPLSSTNVENFMKIHLIPVDICQSETKWWNEAIMTK